MHAFLLSLFPDCQWPQCTKPSARSLPASKLQRPSIGRTLAGRRLQSAHETTHVVTATRVLQDASDSYTVRLARIERCWFVTTECVSVGWPALMRDVNAVCEYVEWPLLIR